MASLKEELQVERRKLEDTLDLERKWKQYYSKLNARATDLTNKMASVKDGLEHSILDARGQGIQVEFKVFK